MWGVVSQIYGVPIHSGASHAQSIVVGIDYDALVTRIVNLGLNYVPEWRMFE